MSTLYFDNNSLYFVDCLTIGFTALESACFHTIKPTKRTFASLGLPVLEERRFLLRQKVLFQSGDQHGFNRSSRTMIRQ